MVQRLILLCKSILVGELRGMTTTEGNIRHNVGCRWLAKYSPFAVVDISYFLSFPLFAVNRVFRIRSIWFWAKKITKKLKKVVKIHILISHVLDSYNTLDLKTIDFPEFHGANLRSPINACAEGRRLELVVVPSSATGVIFSFTFVRLFADTAEVHLIIFIVIFTGNAEAK